MKQFRILILLTGLFLFSIGAMFLFRSNDDDPVEISEEYCEHYPEALVCVDENPSEYEVVYDMFSMMLDEADGAIDDQFCDDHFTGRVQDYCVDDDIRIVPHDFYRISGAIGVIQKDEGQYLITTEYYDKTDAYQFYVDLKVVDGFYQFYGFSYKQETAPIIDFSELDVLTRLDSLMLTQDEDDYCQLNYIEEAYIDCVQSNRLFPYDIDVETLSMSQIGDNTYLFQGIEPDSNQELRITLKFKQVLDVNYVEGISVILID
jgi:hypothetical protein